jgi:hypothetical protein
MHYLQCLVEQLLTALSAEAEQQQCQLPARALSAEVQHHAEQHDVACQAGSPPADELAVAAARGRFEALAGANIALHGSMGLLQLLLQQLSGALAADGGVAAADEEVDGTAAMSGTLAKQQQQLRTCTLDAAAQPAAVAQEVTSRGSMSYHRSSSSSGSSSSSSSSGGGGSSHASRIATARQSGVMPHSSNQTVAAAAGYTAAPSPAGQHVGSASLNLLTAACLPSGAASLNDPQPYSASAAAALALSPSAPEGV